MIRNAIIRSVVAAFLLLGVLAFVVDWNALVVFGSVRQTNDAALDGDVTQLKARVTGYLANVPVRDYQVVRRGTLLFAIDDRDYRARVERARAEVTQGEAMVATAQAALAQQTAQLGVAQANVAAADAEGERARLEWTRQAALLHTESYLARDWQNAVAINGQRKAAAAGARRALAAEQARIGELQADLAGQRASLEGARAALARAAVELGYTRIVAPFDGTTTSRRVRLGDYVAPGTALISLVPLRGAWAVANYREVQVTRMRPGQPARVFVDAVPGVVFSGHVDSLEPYTQAEEALLPPDRATGSFTKIEQRVPVKVVLDPRPAFDARLLPGLSAEVEIDTASAAQ
jgi:membrane fusion protein (multidrug efflux system)